jgi:hypothetical protein
MRGHEFEFATSIAPIGTQVRSCDRLDIGRGHRADERGRHGAIVSSRRQTGGIVMAPHTNEGRSMSEADDQFLETLRRELGPLFGPRLDFLGLELERPDGGRVRITAILRTSGGVWRIVEEGDSLTSVAAAFIEGAPVYRLTDAFREVVEPATIHL